MARTTFKTQRVTVLGVELVETRQPNGRFVSLEGADFRIEYQSGGWGTLFRSRTTRPFAVKMTNRFPGQQLLKTKGDAIRTFANAESAVRAARAELKIEKAA